MAAHRLTVLVVLLLSTAFLAGGCGIAAPYRTADKQTLRDYGASTAYRKQVGVVALLNTTIFTSDQVSGPFMNAFLESVSATATNVDLMVPGRTEAPKFLWSPKRINNGYLDVFDIASRARKAGLNALISPRIVDIRIKEHSSGFWIFREKEYSLQLQTAVAVYDAITGARLDLGVLTDEVDIDEYEVEKIENGQEVMVDDLIVLAEQMGFDLGERMAAAINESHWLASIIAVEKGRGRIHAGIRAGVESGDRFVVLDGSTVLTGLDGQRFIAPGVKIGEVHVDQVTAEQAWISPVSDKLPPVGSILVPLR